MLCSEELEECGTRAEDGISVYRSFHKSWFESDSSVHNSLGSSSSVKGQDFAYIYTVKQLRFIYIFIKERSQE